AENTEGWTGAELTDLVDKSLSLIYRKRAATVAEALEQALECLIPSTAAVMDMTMEALGEINDFELLPKRLHAIARKLRQQQAQKAEAKIERGDLPAADERDAREL